MYARLFVLQANGVIVLDEDVDEKLKELPDVQIKSKLDIDDVNIHFTIIQEVTDEVSKKYVSIESTSILKMRR